MKPDYYSERFWPDVDAIVRDWQAAGYRQAAERFYDALERTVQAIREQPGRGHPRPDLRPAGLRCVRIPGFANWEVLYQLMDRDAGVAFLRVRYGRRGDTNTLPADTRLLPGNGGD